MNDTTPPDVTIARIAADIVVAFVSRNQISPSEVIDLTHEVKAALMPDDVRAPRKRRRTGEASASTIASLGHYPNSGSDADIESNDAVQAQQPAVPVDVSVCEDHVHCLEDGKKFRSLKRHLRQEHGLTPEAYRKKWKLPPDYPMVAPSYSSVRTRLAKDQGLGVRKAGVAEPVHEPAD